VFTRVGTLSRRLREIEGVNPAADRFLERVAARGIVGIEPVHIVAGAPGEPVVTGSELRQRAQARFLVGQAASLPFFSFLPFVTSWLNASDSSPPRHEGTQKTDGRQDGKLAARLSSPKSACPTAR
jgi:hypothetical protein